MGSRYLRNVAVVVLLLSVGLMFLSGQSRPVAASSHHGYWGGNWGRHWSWGGSYYYSYWYYPYYYYAYPYCYSTWSPYYWCHTAYYYYSPAPSSYTLTVSTDPSSLGTVNGGGSYTSGSSASFSVTQSTVQVSPNTRYVFDHWSGDYSGVGTSGTVTLNNGMSVTAVYELQYYLSVNAQPQNAPAAQGAGWYNAGATATVQSESQTVGDSGSRLVFQGWSVDGQPTQAGSTLSVVMNAPHTVTAQYGQQYYLNVQTDQGVASGSGWYDAGSTAQIYVSTPVSTQYGVSIVFNGWRGGTQSTSQSTTLIMDGPKNVIATWRTDSTILYMTITAMIIAVLIVAGVMAFIARGRGDRASRAPA